MQIESSKGTISEINSFEFDKIKLLLNKYKYPLVFFDFESFSYPIPLVTKAKPWEQVCSQYSMHVLKENYDISKHYFNEKGESGGIIHYEFIGNPQEDKFISPDLNLIQSFMNDLANAGINWEQDSFSIVVFNASYEKGKFKRIKEKYPRFEKFIDVCLNNIVDLREFFINGFWYRKDFNGKTGLKTIIKAIINDKNILRRYMTVDNFKDNLDYSKGLINNGSLALDAYQSLLRKVLLSSEPYANHDLILNELKYYCKLDTWSTVIIYDLIKNITNEYYLGNFKNW